MEERARKWAASGAEAGHFPCHVFQELLDAATLLLQHVIVRRHLARRRFTVDFAPRPCWQ